MVNYLSLVTNSDAIHDLPAPREERLDLWVELELQINGQRGWKSAPAGKWERECLHRKDETDQNPQVRRSGRPNLPLPSTESCGTARKKEFTSREHGHRFDLPQDHCGHISVSKTLIEKFARAQTRSAVGTWGRTCSWRCATPE